MMFWFSIAVFVLADLAIVGFWWHERQQARIISRNTFERRREQPLHALTISHRFERKPRRDRVVVSMLKGRTQ